MKIGVIGGGNVGTALARRLVPKGHEVMLSFSRDPVKLEHAAKTFGARTGSPREAVEFAEVVAFAVPWAAVDGALHDAGSLAGKIVWDCTNALKPDLSGLALGTSPSGGERVQGLEPGARVVKGIPPFAELLHSAEPTLDGEPVSVFVCGDDAAAKGLVATLLASLPATVTDAGPLENARYVEPAMMLLVRLAYGQGLGPLSRSRFCARVPTSGNPVNERWGPTSARRLPKVGGLYPAHDPMGALG